MDWLPLASAALGGVIGSGSTLLADRLRWRRERELRQSDLAREAVERQTALRRETYTQYLAALSKARNGLREVAHAPTLSHDERVDKLRELFLSSGAYELRFQMQLSASTDLVDLAEAAYKSLRILRTRIEDGAMFSDGLYLAARDAYHGALRDLRAGMRDELGVDPI
ncbi:hypothetical protein AB0I66_27030 [Streptomyces sp. NPDC050439]|uniref:hypothetical protein n=1 Tax=unclassified Streptomyces TaxID=2593676 RepID=UPI00342AE3BA